MDFFKKLFESKAEKLKAPPKTLLTCDVHDAYLADVYKTEPLIITGDYDGARTAMNAARENALSKVNFVKNAHPLLFEAFFNACGDTHLSHVDLTAGAYRDALFRSENAILLLEKDNLEDFPTYTQALAYAIKASIYQDDGKALLKNTKKLRNILLSQATPKASLVAVVEDALQIINSNGNSNDVDLNMPQP